MRRGLTPTQTVGPFFLECLLREDMRYNVVAGPGTEGEPIRIEGHVYDGDRAPVPDALVEIWQADSRGRYWSPADDRGELPADRPRFYRVWSLQHRRLGSLLVRDDQARPGPAGW